MSTYIDEAVSLSAAKTQCVKMSVKMSYHCCCDVLAISSYARVTLVFVSPANDDELRPALKGA
jgi:hypothetical protein